MQRFDVLRSIPNDLFERSKSGGVLTIIVVLFAEMLAISEIMWYFTTTYVETVGVGNTFNDRMDLYLDVTFHAMACDQVEIRLWDKYQDKPVPIAGSSFHMTRVIDGTRDMTTTKETDLHHHDKDFLAHSMFEHAELERDWDRHDTAFNENTFKEQIDAHDLTFYMFYADWCPHCRVLHPKWKKAVAEIDNQDIRDADGKILKLGMFQINCVPHETLCWENDVSDYPTLRLYSRDMTFVTFDYAKESTEETVRRIVDYVKESALKTHHEDYWMPDRQKEGCHLKGLLRIPRVPGHLQFNKRGKGHSVGWADLSHTVHSYSFLDPDDSISVGATGLETNPLDQKRFDCQDKKTAIAHYATLVQTQLRQRYFGYRYVYQMSVLSVENKLVDKRKLSIRFVHDMFPMAVKYDFETKSFGHFIIRLCAIIGGLYTIFNIIHNVAKKKAE